MPDPQVSVWGRRRGAGGGRGAPLSPSEAGEASSAGRGLSWTGRPKAAVLLTQPGRALGPETDGPGSSNHGLMELVRSQRFLLRRSCQRPPAFLLVGSASEPCVSKESNSAAAPRPGSGDRKTRFFPGSVPS